MRRPPPRPSTDLLLRLRRASWRWSSCTRCAERATRRPALTSRPAHEPRAPCWPRVAGRDLLPGRRPRGFESRLCLQGTRGPFGDLADPGLVVASLHVVMRTAPMVSLPFSEFAAQRLARPSVVGDVVLRSWPQLREDSAGPVCRDRSVAYVARVERADEHVDGNVKVKVIGELSGGDPELEHFA